MGDEVSNRGDEWAVIVRFTQYDTKNPADWFSIQAAYRDLVEAEREAMRLNALPQRRRPVKYFVKIVKAPR
jgi:hypothetical protein